MIAKLTKLRCPQCGKRLGIPRKLAGKTFPCPKCGVTFSIAEDLTHLRPLAAPQAEEPIVAEVVEPPLAQSVEQPESAKFPWLIVILIGVILITLLVIGGVVLSLPAKSPATAPSLDPPTITEPAADDEPETNAAVENIYDRNVTEPIVDGENADVGPQPEATQEAPQTTEADSGMAP